MKFAGAVIGASGEEEDEEGLAGLDSECPPPAILAASTDGNIRIWSSLVRFAAAYRFSVGLGVGSKLAGWIVGWIAGWFAGLFAHLMHLTSAHLTPGSPPRDDVGAV